MTKSFNITKQVVFEAYKRVKSNRGCSGVDDETIEEFERDLKKNLYRIWNRMSSGTYFPPAVRLVEIPKANGEKRPLGIPTVSDRIAQMVAKMCLEPELDQHFEEDSYGYRPNKSALQALTKARERCWQFAWVIDIDIKGFFDNLDHELLMKAVKKHAKCKWLILYIERWIKAPLQLQDGQLQRRETGTPQGGVISPLLANLYLHYTFDVWMKHNNPMIKYERYADDIICHCQTEFQAKELLEKLKARFTACGLMLHPQKTKIVYCKDDRRSSNYPCVSFDFLGYTFKPRKARSREGEIFQGFNPAVSQKAMKNINTEIRSWRLQSRVDKTLNDLGRIFNPIIRGWLNYYGKYNKTVLSRVFKRLDQRLVHWLMRKCKRLRGHTAKAREHLRKVIKHNPTVFAHWRFFYPEMTALRAV